MRGDFRVLALADFLVAPSCERSEPRDDPIVDRPLSPLGACGGTHGGLHFLHAPVDNHPKQCLLRMYCAHQLVLVLFEAGD